MDQLLTTAQVGQALSRSSDWVRRQITAGEFQAVKDGGARARWLIPEKSVQAWVNARTVQRTRAASVQVGNRALDEIRRRRQQRGGNRQTA